MSKRNRDRKRSIGLVEVGLAIGVLFVFVAVVFLSNIKTNYNENRHYQPQTYAPPAKYGCIEAPGLLVLCPQESGNPEADAQRDNDDLKAQQEMADWAFLVAVTSIASLIFSVGGVALVYATLHETRAANDAIRESTEKQLRAYLMSPRIKGTNFLASSVPTIEVNIRNEGQTPAKVVKASVNIRSVSPDQIHTNKLYFREETTSVGYIAPATAFSHVQDFLSPLTQEEFDMIKDQGQIFLVRGILIYSDVFGITRRLVYKTIGRLNASDGTMGFELTPENNRAS